MTGTMSMLLESEYDFELALIGAPQEQDDERAPDYQSALSDADRSLRELDIDLSTGTSFAKAANIGTWLNGDFVIHIGTAAAFAAVVARPFVPVMTEWLKGRAGRKVRLRRGEKEVEAGTIEEAERAWKFISGDEPEPS